MAGMAPDELFLVDGLGHPGPTYAHNRHNIGFGVGEELAGRVGGKFKAPKTNAELVEGRLGCFRVALAKPRTYMNLSGGPLAALVRFFKLEPASVVVVHDELDIPFDTLRLK